ncbi:hypothetical protein ACFFU8_09160 [Chromobacterium piscinae]|nr:hypothetical protein [Chromobacterium piscinae]
MEEKFTAVEANDMGAFVEDAVSPDEAAQAEPVNREDYQNEKTAQ